MSEFSLAEGEGFEPSIRYNRIPDFESGAFDLSATLPRQERSRTIQAFSEKSKAARSEESAAALASGPGPASGPGSAAHHFAAGTILSAPFM